MVHNFPSGRPRLPAKNVGCHPPRTSISGTGFRCRYQPTPRHHVEFSDGLGLSRALHVGLGHKRQMMELETPRRCPMACYGMFRVCTEVCAVQCAQRQQASRSESTQLLSTPGHADQQSPSASLNVLLIVICITPEIVRRLYVFKKYSEACPR